MLGICLSWSERLGKRWKGQTEYRKKTIYQTKDKKKDEAANHVATEIVFEAMLKRNGDSTHEELSISGSLMLFFPLFFFHCCECNWNRAQIHNIETFFFLSKGIGRGHKQKIDELENKEGGAKKKMPPRVNWYHKSKTCKAHFFQANASERSSTTRTIT